jgi:hypothetical protein
MLALPVTLMRLSVKVAPLFSKRVWGHGQVLIVGALLAPGNRPVSAVSGVMGLSQEPQFQKYHRVLKRARWSSVAVARVLLGRVVHTVVPVGPVIIGIGDTVERRRGAKITAKGISRDPVRSSRSHVVKARGRRWLCAMVSAEIAWAGRLWALPFLTALGPSQRYHQQRGRRHKTVPEWAGQLVGLIHRWLPRREVGVVAASSYAGSEWLNRVRAIPGVSVITRWRLEAALYDPALPHVPRHNGRPRKPGARRPPPHHLLNDSQTRWTPLTVTNGYGGGARGVEVGTDTAVWSHAGLPPAAIRWLLIRDPPGECEPPALGVCEIVWCFGQIGRDERITTGEWR